MVHFTERSSWRGSSGDRYDYHVLPLGFLAKNVLGNYIFARRKASSRWDAVYVGQGLLRADISDHFLGREIRDKAVTHVHFRENPIESARRIEMADILDGNPEAYAPEGCNPPPVHDVPGHVNSVDLASMAMWRLR
jgi:hypothetical protein